MFHVFYSIVGLAVIVSQSILLFNVIKWAGAAYLIWLGIKALRSKDAGDIELSPQPSTQTSFVSFKQGLLTNVLNPKVTLFFLSLFTQIINPNTSSLVKTLYGVELVLITFVWFSIVAILMTQSPIRAAYQRAKNYINRACLLYTSPSPRDQRGSRMPSSA